MTVNGNWETSRNRPPGVFWGNSEKGHKLPPRRKAPRESLHSFFSVRVTGWLWML